jgi:hypothetical protein
MCSRSPTAHSPLTVDLEPQLLGYDVRLDRSVYAKAWTSERREYLANTDTERPLSVDWQVWPSYFVERNRLPPERGGKHLEPYLIERAIEVDLPEDKIRFHGLRLWASLGDMLECYAERKYDAATGVVIAVWLEHATSAPHAHFEVVLDPDVSPHALGKNWALLGYDVADQWLSTALTNRWADREALRVSIGAKLNPHGLFGARQDALEFRQTSDELFQDGRPFSVYGLYRIPL